MPGPIGGSGPMWQRAIWLFISCCIALALYQGVIGGNPATAWERLQHKSEEVRKDAENLGKKIDDGIAKQPGGNTRGEPSRTPAKPNHQQ